VLTLFSGKPDRFADSAYDIVLLLIAHAGTVVDNASLYHDSTQLVTQLRDIATQLVTAHEHGEFDAALDQLGLTGPTEPVPAGG
jgi:hypothetical protein